MNIQRDNSEGLQLLLSFLKDNEGKVVSFLLVDGSFLIGTLDHFPMAAQDELRLTKATHYSSKKEKQELEQVDLTVGKIFGWGAGALHFLETED